jgi:hypothetical protein
MPPATGTEASASGAAPGSTQAPAGGGSETTTASAADAGAPPAAELPPMPTGLHGPAHPWAHMNAHDRGRYMNEAVLPAMSALLRAYDPARYAQVTCATCHGANAQQVHFRMPNSLPALHRPGTPAAQHAFQENPRIFQFMGTRVVPAMAQLLGEQPFNMQTHQGFGCAACHPHAAD